jgi:hypothetical protein
LLVYPTTMYHLPGLNLEYFRILKGLQAGGALLGCNATMGVERNGFAVGDGGIA